MSSFFSVNKYVAVSVLLEWIDSHDFLVFLSSVCNKKTNSVLKSWIFDFKSKFQLKLFSSSHRYKFTQDFAAWVEKWRFDVQDSLLTIEEPLCVTSDFQIKRLQYRHKGSDLGLIRPLLAMSRCLEEVHVSYQVSPNIASVICLRSSIRVLCLSTKHWRSLIVLVCRNCINLEDLELDFDIEGFILLSIAIHARKLRRLVFLDSLCSQHMSSVFLLHSRSPYTKLSITSFTSVSARFLHVKYPDLTVLRIHHSASDAVTTLLMCRFSRLADLSVIHNESGLRCWLSNELATYSNLTSLECILSSAEPGSSLETLQSCTLLRRLILTVAFKTTILSVRSIAHLSLLEVLFMRSFIITDDDLIAIARGCRCLKYLSLVGNRDISDASVSVLAESCTRLIELNLSSCSVGDVGLSAIAMHCDDLRVVEVSRNSLITDNGIGRLFSLPLLLRLVADKIPSLSGKLVIQLRDFHDKNCSRYYKYSNNKEEKSM